MKKLKALSILVLTLIVLSAVPVLATSPASPKATVKAFFKYAKQGNVSKMEKLCKKDPDFSEFLHTKYGKSALKYVNTKLSYSIKSIKTDEKASTIKVKCKYKDSYKAWSSAMTDGIAYFFSSNNPSKSKGQNVISKRFIKYVKKGKYKASSKTVTIKLIKAGKTWKLKNVSTKLREVVLANYQKAADE